MLSRQRLSAREHRERGTEELTSESIRPNTSCDNPTAVQRDGTVRESHRGVMPAMALVGRNGFKEEQEHTHGFHLLR
jgi:hypothetical protein